MRKKDWLQLMYTLLLCAMVLLLARSCERTFTDPNSHVAQLNCEAAGWSHPTKLEPAPQFGGGD